MEKVFKMKFCKIYDALLTKLEKKNRTKDELDQTISWLTGYETIDIEKNYNNNELNYEEFFKNAPNLNPNRNKVTGKICGVDIEQIDDEIYKNMRILDKLVDQLAKGKRIENVLM